jgi:hypothetical protein
MLLLLVSAVAELVVIALNAPGLQKDFGLPVGFTLFAAGAILSLACGIAVHEAGHLLGARLAGLRPYFVRVGPVAFAQQGGRWRLCWEPRQPWIGGLVLCHLRGAGRAQLALFLACGPLANFAAGALAVVLAVFPAWSLWQSWSGQFAVLSLFLGAVNLLPLRERRFNSDGLGLWRLLAFGRG